MNNREDNNESFTLKERRLQFSIEIRKKQNQEYFRKSRRAFIDRQQKKQDNQTMEKKQIPQSNGSFYFFYTSVILSF